MDDNTVEMMGGVPSSQAEVDGTALDDETKSLVVSTADQVDIWFKKLANIEKRRDSLQRAISSGLTEDIPADIRVKKMDLPTLPGGLFYSLGIRQSFRKMMKDHQTAVMRAVVLEYGDVTIPEVELSISLLMEKSKKDFIRSNFPLESCKQYELLVDDKRKNRMKFLDVPVAAPKDPSKVTQHQPKEGNQRQTSRQPQQKTRPKPYNRRNDHRKDFRHDNKHR